MNHNATRLADLPLGALGRMALIERAELIEHDHGAAVAGVIDHLSREAPMPAAMPSRLTWAVAFNVSGPLRSYVDEWTAEIPWLQAWSRLATTRGGKRRYVPLEQLALSVGCELRDDWQPEAARPVSEDQALDILGYVYAENHPDVRSFVASRFRPLGLNEEDCEDVCGEAWARMTRNFWSEKARQRFLACKSIASFISSIATNVAYDILRRRRVEERHVVVDANSGTEDKKIVEGTPDPTTSVEEIVLTRQNRQLLASCLPTLTTREREAVTLVALHGLSLKDAAAQMGVQPPRVHQLRAAALTKLRRCLAQRGY